MKLVGRDGDDPSFPNSQANSMGGILTGTRCRFRQRRWRFTNSDSEGDQANVKPQRVGVSKKEYC